MVNTEVVVISLAVLVGLVALVFWSAMVVHCWKNRELSSENRVLWLLFIVCGELLGAGAYYFLRYRQRPTIAAPC